MSDAVFTIVRRHRLHMPADLVMLLKTLAMYEGVGRVLDPEFNIIPVAKPFVEKEMRRRLLPSEWGPTLRQGLLDTTRMSMNLPGQLRRLARRVDRGEFTVVVQHQELDASLNRIEKMANRLAVSVLVGASLVGFGLLLVAYRPDLSGSWWGWLFWIGFVFTAAAGIWLAFDIRRNQRR